MTEQELLSRLRDVHAPLEPDWWPPAPGWWILLLIVIVLVALATRHAIPRLERWRMRRRLLVALEAIERRHHAGAAPVVTEVSQLLRVAALECFPQESAAGLHGDDWIRFLESHDRAPGRFTALREALTVAPYRRPETISDARPLLRAARDWLRAVI